MEVKIKVLYNGKEIEEAKAENGKRANQRNHELQKAKKDRVEILDIVVPEPKTKDQPRHFNAFDVDWWTISQNDMIFIATEKGEKFECLRSEDVETELAKAISLKEDFKRKSLQLK